MGLCNYYQRFVKRGFKQICFVFGCRNLSLGLATKTKGYKVAGQEGNPRAFHMLPGVQRVWGHEPSHSQVKSHVGSWSPERTLEFLECNRRGQNSSPWRVLYIIGKLLKCRCLKWVRIAHLDIWNPSYGQKKDRESNWQFDSRPLKVGNWLDSLACRQRATYRWKALDEGYIFALDRIAIGSVHKKLCALKVARIPVDATHDAIQDIMYAFVWKNGQILWKEWWYAFTSWISYELIFTWLKRIRFSLSMWWLLTWHGRW
jgi:hypothetical protein